MRNTPRHVQSTLPAVSLLLALFAGPTTAHHSISPFDSTKFAEIEGEITKVSWRNPHLGLELLVKAADGTQQTWRIEGDAINTLLRRGLTREMFEVGQNLRLGGFPSARGRQELMPTNVLLPDGKEVLMLDADYPLRWTTPPSDVAIDLQGSRAELFRVWTGEALYKRVQPFSLTPAAQSAIAAWDPLTDTPALRCMAPGMPNANLNPYPIEFIDMGDHILLRIEEWNAERRIDMVAREIPADAPPSPLGYSIGSFNGAILEIRTGRLSGGLLDDDGIPMSSNATVFETYRVNGTTNTLDYRMTVTDPQYLEAPGEWFATWESIAGAEVRHFECQAAAQ